MNMTILVGNYRWGDKEETLPLADALDKGGVYKSGQRTCRRCLAAKTETCPYTVGVGYSLDGGQTWDVDTAATGDVIPLPPCPVVQAIADGRTTWDKVNRATRQAWRKHWPK